MDGGGAAEEVEAPAPTPAPAPAVRATKKKSQRQPKVRKQQEKISSCYSFGIQDVVIIERAFLFLFLFSHFKANALFFTGLLW